MANGEQKPRRRVNPRSHVAKTLMREQVQLGMAQLDGRSRLNKALKQLRKDLLAELGGEAALPSHAALVDVAVRTKMLLDTVDGHILQIGDRIINKRRRQLYPLMEQRRQLADSLSAQLTKLNELRQLHEIENRIEALEAARNV